jgi:hypothetical protein
MEVAGGDGYTSNRSPMMPWNFRLSHQELGTLICPITPQFIIEKEKCP